MKFDLILKYNNYITEAKELVRTGWIRSGIEHGESIAEHMYHTAVNILLLKILLKEISINWDKVLKMSLLHDLAEIIVGDIPAPEKKDIDRIKEKNILVEMSRELNLPVVWIDEIMSYNSIEGIIVKVSDLISTIFQGLKYIEKGYKNRYLKEIINNSLKELNKITIISKRKELYILNNFIKGYVKGTLIRHGER